MELSNTPQTNRAANNAPPGQISRPVQISDGLFALILIAGAAFSLNKYSAYMDVYERLILIGFVPALASLGWFWPSFKGFFCTSFLIGLLGIYFYQGDLSHADTVFALKYFISSQTAIMWMSVFTFLSCAAYWIGLISQSDFTQHTATRMVWLAALMGTAGLLVRWYESYLIGADIGHIPISNLYEVFVLFIIITSLLYLYYEQSYNTCSLGAFCTIITSAATVFLLWYSFTREAHAIQPLVPALQSYWMKIHVPANFIGYGSFTLAAMAGVAYLVAVKTRLGARLPKPALIEDLMYKSIAIGFAFFTIATILGALWAAEAWGTYWQWDPKETWALIVWITYASWLHMRLTKGLRGETLAWWAVIGLVVTSFAFLGVNMFLSGLHSYGEL